jgi:hypothetical protein
VNINTDGIISLCFGIENNYVSILTSARHYKRGIIVLYFFGFIEKMAAGSCGSKALEGIWKVNKTWLGGSPICLL